MSLTKTIPDGEWATHMIKRGDFRIAASTGPKEEEIAHVEHFREIIGITDEWLLGIPVGKWIPDMMGVINVGIWVILIPNGTPPPYAN